MIEIRRTTLQTCHGTDGIVVVIDVLRAFTTTAFAFERGARAIVLAAKVEEAFALRERLPGSLLIGEVGGLPIDGFDLPNSPTAVADADLDGRTLILRTSSGTQGVVRTRGAEHLLGASLANAAATAEYVRARAPAVVTFVETGIRDDGGGEEDTACADLIAGLVLGAPPPLDDVRRRVRGSRWAAKFADPDQPDFPASDLELCLETNRFASAMQVRREDDLLVLRPSG